MLLAVLSCRIPIHPYSRTLSAKGPDLDGLDRLSRMLGRVKSSFIKGTEENRVDDFHSPKRHRQPLRPREQYLMTVIIVAQNNVRRDRTL